VTVSVTSQTQQEEYSRGKWHLKTSSDNEGRMCCCVRS